jgi:hypothetical protein
MRSFAAKAAMAVIFVSTSLTGAFAAGAQYPSTMPQAMHTQSSAKPTMASASTAAPKYRPRLTHIMNEVHAANQRIAIDHRRGYLNAAEFRKLEKQSNAIRNSALHVARLHEGALPAGNYQNLQRRVASLNHSIHLNATKRA